MQPFIHPPDIMDIDIKNPEVDVTDDHFKKLIIYTDGRQLPKKIDEDHPEIVAHWSGSQLVSDEKSPLSGKMSRTYELSGDGRRLYETVHIDHGKRPAIIIRYVYDATNSDVQSGLGTDDPDRPVIKRHSDSDDSTTLRPNRRSSGHTALPTTGAAYPATRARGSLRSKATQGTNERDLPTSGG